MDFGGHSNLDALIKDVTQLVSLPDVYYRLEVLIEDPSSTLYDFAEVLSVEPDICARLLSLANSAFYSFPASIETVDKAVQIIGTRQIRELVLASSVVNVFSQMPLGMLNMRAFWEHSVTVGVFTKTIGQYCHLRQPERFYVAGLLHDIGRLLFLLKMPGLMHDLFILREAKEKYLRILEFDSLGYTHAEAGGRLLEQWRVPDSIHEPVTYHHNPTASPEYTSVSAAINIADAWVNNHQVGSSGERFDMTISPESLEILNINIGELDEVWLKAQQEVKAIISQFINQ